MKKRYSFWAKSLAFLLMLVCLAGAVFSGILAAFGVEFGLYNGRDFWTSRISQIALADQKNEWFTDYEGHYYGHGTLSYAGLVSKAQRTALSVEEKQAVSAYQDAYNPQFTNERIRVIKTQDDGTETVLGTLGGEWTNAVKRVSTDTLNAEDRAVYGVDYIEYGIDSTFRANDSLRWWYNMTNFIRNSMASTITFLVFGILGFFAAMIYLFITCGHRPDQDGIVLRRFDRWPLLVVACLLAVPFWAGMACLMEAGWYNDLLPLLLFLCAGSLIVLLVGFCLLMTVIVRCKAGMLWKTTLLYYAGTALGRSAGKATQYVEARKADKQAREAEAAPQYATAESAIDAAVQQQVAMAFSEVKPEADTAHKVKDKLRGVLILGDKAKEFQYEGSWLQRAWHGLCGFVKRCGQAIGGGIDTLREGFAHLGLTWKGLLLGGGIALVYLILCAIGDTDGGPTFATFLFSVLVLFVLLRVLGQMAVLQEGAEKLARGDLSYKIPTDHLRGPFRKHAELLGSISDGMAVAVEHRLKSEKLKTELLTNVSHDIKTPLTSIINYVDLLKKTDLQPEEAREYADVLERQSQRLKKLLEDLIEASKASTGNINVSLAPTDAAELLRQSIGEYNERLKACSLSPVLRIGTADCTITADGRLLWRVFDNLLGNIVKYAMPGTRVYLDVSAQGSKTEISLKNISRDELNIDTDELMERFVRGDASRATEGSGLGLSIARSLTECMGGAFALQIDGDLFKVTLSFDGPEVPPAAPHGTEDVKG